MAQVADSIGKSLLKVLQTPSARKVSISIIMNFVSKAETFRRIMMGIRWGMVMFQSFVEFKKRH